MYYEQGQKAALGKTADENRQKDIDNNKLGTGKGNGNGGGTKQKELSASELETAQRLGFANNPAKMKTYREQIFRRRAN